MHSGPSAAVNGGGGSGYCGVPTRTANVEQVCVAHEPSGMAVNQWEFCFAKQCEWRSVRVKLFDAHPRDRTGPHTPYGPPARGT